MEAAYRHALTRDESGYDELVRAEGQAAETWARIGMDGWTTGDLRRVRETTARLLEDDGVFHTPLSDAPAVVGSTPLRMSPWRLDPVPIIVPPAEWSWLERGVEQRSRLLERVLDDLYGPRRLLTSGLVPPELLWRWSGRLRPAWGAQPAGRPRLVLTGFDVGRGSEGAWCVIADRTQSPQGLGYAAENRKVTARVLPEAFRSTEVRRLSGFFDRIRAALSDLAPSGTEDPRVVVLTPGQGGDSGFDQAQLANLLGLPLVTGDDLTVDRGRLWSRGVGGGSGDQPVDVVVRRVPEEWCDPLELRPDSRLGVPGLLSAARRGSVVLANALGSGLVESPALGAILADLAEPLVDEPLALPSAPAWWCGDPAGLSHVKAHLDEMVLRPVDPSHAEVTVGSVLTRAARERWVARLEAEPGAWVGQQQLPLSTSPTVARLGLEPRRVSMRLFAAAREGSYAVLPGGLGRVVPDALDPTTRRRDRVAVSKDVWVTTAAGTPVPVAPPRPERTLLRGAASVPVVPRALEQLFWFGRYAERAEANARLVLSISSLVDETSYGGRGAGMEAISRLIVAMERLHLDEQARTIAVPDPPDHPGQVDATLRDLMVDHGRDGSLSATLNELLDSAGAVRDQLSGDVFVVLGDVERACTDLEEIGTARVATPADTHDEWLDGRTRRRALGMQVRETALATLTGTLALTGITAENMVRDTGWQMLEAGRALERTLGTVRLVEDVFARRLDADVEATLVNAVLVASESVVTHRRRYAGRVDLASLVELLLLDPGNPRSVAFGLRRLRTATEALPRTAASVRILGEIESAAGVLSARGATSLAQVGGSSGGSSGGGSGTGTPLGETDDDPLRHDLSAVSEIVVDCLRRFSREIASAYFRHAGPPRRLGSGLAPSAPWNSGTLGRPEGRSEGAAG